jgi:ADP-ribose pyrophosphatase
MRNEGTSTLLTRKSVYPGRTVKLDLERVALPNGHVVELEIVHHPGASAVVPLLPDGDVLLVRQFRHAIGGWLLEVPAGKLDPGEAPETCATRELSEETGHAASTLVRLGRIHVSPGFCDEVIHLFLARDLVPGEQRHEHGEVLSVERMAFEEALRLVREGAITDSKTIAALSLARFQGHA